MMAQMEKKARGSCKTAVPQKIDDFDASSQDQQAGPCRADETMPEWAGEEAQREMAPKGRFYGAHEFCNCLDRWDLTHLAEKICNRNVRCYIGNRDMRVGTGACFEFISTLSDTAFEQKISSSPIELIIGPSIGHKGHGTSPEVFRQGAAWMEKKLLGEGNG